jgi:hypothetical protein
MLPVKAKTRAGSKSALDNAQRITSLMARFLKSRRVRGWGDVFAEIALALDRGEVERARTLYRDMPRATMGGFTDFGISRKYFRHRTVDEEVDNELLDLLYDLVATSFHSLRPANKRKTTRDRKGMSKG